MADIMDDKAVIDKLVPKIGNGPLGDWSYRSINRLISDNDELLKQDLLKPVSELYPTETLLEICEKKASVVNERGESVAKNAINRFTIHLGSSVAFNNEYKQGIESTTKTFLTELAEFYGSIFNREERGHIEELLQNDEPRLCHLVVYNIVYRKGRNIAWRQDAIVGAVTFLVGETTSLISYIAIAQYPVVTENFTSGKTRPKDGLLLCKSGLGTFLLAAVQRISDICEKHTNICLQANDDEKIGAGMFYRKLLFNKVPDNHEHILYFHEKFPSGINQHEGLQWMISMVPIYKYHPKVLKFSKIPMLNSIRKLEVVIELAKKVLFKGVFGNDVQFRMGETFKAYDGFREKIFRDPQVEISLENNLLGKELEEHYNEDKPGMIADHFSKFLEKLEDNWYLENKWNKDNNLEGDLPDFKNENYKVLSKVVLGDYNHEQEIRLFLYYILSAMSLIDPSVEAERYKYPDTKSIFYNFNKDLLSALARLEGVMEGAAKHWKNNNLLSWEDYPQDSARNHDIHVTLKEIASAQLRNCFYAGSLEVKIIASIFNLTFTVIGVHYEITGPKITAKLTNQKSMFSKYKCFPSSKNGREITPIAFCDKERNLHLLSRVNNSQINSVVNPPKQKKLSVADWFKFRKGKLFKGQLFKPSEIEAFIPEENQLLVAKLLDPLEQWDQIVSCLTTKSTISLNPDKWLEGLAIEVFLDFTIKEIQKKLDNPRTYFVLPGVANCICHNVDVRERVLKEVVGFDYLMLIMNETRLHWLTLQIEIPKERVDILTVYIADSMGSDVPRMKQLFLGLLSNELYVCIALFLNLKDEDVLTSYEDFVDKKKLHRKYISCLNIQFVKHRTDQRNGYDCGVHTVMRAVRAAETDEIDVSKMAVAIMPPRTYRLHMINTVVNVKSAELPEAITTSPQFENELHEYIDNIEPDGSDKVPPPDVLTPNRVWSAIPPPDTIKSSDGSTNWKAVRTSSTPIKLDFKNKRKSLTTHNPKSIKNIPNKKQKARRRNSNRKNSDDDASDDSDDSDIEGREGPSKANESIIRKAPKPRDPNAISNRITIFQLKKEFDQQHPFPFDNEIDSVPQAKINELVEIRKRKLSQSKRDNWMVEAYNKSQLSEESAKAQCFGKLNKELQAATNEYLKVNQEYEQHLAFLKNKLDKAAKRSKKLTTEPWSVAEKRKKNELEQRWIEASAKVDILKWEKERIPIFHPKDNIKAIQVKDLPARRGSSIQEKRTKRYFAFAQQEDGTKHNKEVSLEFLKENFDPVFLKELDRHHDEKGWLTLEKANTTKVPFADVYDYKPPEKGAKVLYFKIHVYCKQKGQEPIEVEDRAFFIKTTKSDGKYCEISDKTAISIFGAKQFNTFSFMGDSQAKHDINTISAGKSKFDLKIYYYEEKANNRRERHSFIRTVDRDDNKYQEHSVGNIGIAQVVHFSLRQQHYTVEVNTSQISRMKYDPLKDVFLGIEKEANPGQANTVPKIVELDTRWVNENFTKDQRTVLKTAAQNGNKRFLQVPVGDQIEIFPTMDISLNPAIHYPNNESSICAFASLSNALYHKGFVSCAAFIMSSIPTIRNSDSKFGGELQSLIRVIQNEDQFQSFRKIYRWHKIKRGTDILKSTTSTDIHLVVIHQSDNHTSHAIAITDDLIFDCNASNALPLSKEGIDCCCGVDATFEYVDSGYTFFMNTKKNINVNFNGLFQLIT